MTVMPPRDLAASLGAAMRKTVAIPLVKQAAPQTLESYLNANFN